MYSFSTFNYKTKTINNPIEIRTKCLPGFCSVSQNESMQFVNVAISNIFDFCRQCVPSRTCVTSQDLDFIVGSKLNTYKKKIIN
jgi:hypothetical protein